MNPHLPHVSDFADTGYAPPVPQYANLFVSAQPTNSADDDAKVDTLFERPVKKAKISDDSGVEPASSYGLTTDLQPALVMMPSVGAVPSVPLAGPPHSASSAPPTLPAVIPSAPAKYATIPPDGFKFHVGAEVEYFIPDEDLYWSFGWLRVRVISRAKKQIGSKLLPHYVVEPLDGEDKTQTTVEEWQLRPQNKFATGMLGKRLPKLTRVEVHSTFEDGRAETWFCAEVLDESQAAEETVRVRYRNNKWNSVSQATRPSKMRVRPVPPEDLHPTTGVSAKIWAIGGARLPIRLLSDEEHKVQELLGRFESIQNRWVGQSRISPVEFESDRDALNELCDSLNNARYYNKTMEIVQFLLDVHRRFE